MIHDDFEKLSNDFEYPFKLCNIKDNLIAEKVIENNLNE